MQPKQYMKPEERAQKVIAELDSRLEVIEMYKPGPTKGVYRVRRGDEDLVLRWEEIPSWRNPERAGIMKEARALEALDGIECVPRLVEVYTGEILAVLKTHMPGERLDKFADKRRKKRRLFARNHKRYLSSGLDLLAQVHSRGVCGIDVHQQNILVGEERIYLFDFEKNVLKVNLPARYFVAWGEEDKHRMKHFLKSYL